MFRSASRSLRPPPGETLAAPAAMAGVLLAAVAWTAWLCDDAFITVRSVDNLVSGHGLRWNVAERVQVFTHPLWALLQVPLHAVVREGWCSLMVLSLGTSLATLLVLVVRHRERPGWLAVALAALASSKAFVEYSTSGLENPLTHLLLALALAAWLEPPGSRRRLERIALCTGLALANRLDAALLFGPLLVAAGFQERGHGRLIAAAALAAVPVAAWEAFSLLYYGYPFPNTAYAKLGTDLPAGFLVRQGLLYLTSLLSWDLPSFLLLFAGIAAGLVLDRRRWAVPALGVALHLIYVTRIGGDFMVGRFYSAPVLVGALALAHVPRELPRPGWIAAGALVLLTLMGPTAPFRTGTGFGFDLPPGVQEGELVPSAFSGIADERRFYFQGTSLVGRPFRPLPVVHRFAADGRTAAYTGRSPVVYPNAGFFGYHAGPRIHVVDAYGLTDPVLARLPVDTSVPWRVGHVHRPVPDGLLESLASGRNRLTDPQAAAVWDDVRPRVASPLGAPGRLRRILGLRPAP